MPLLSTVLNSVFATLVLNLMDFISTTRRKSRVEFRGFTFGAGWRLNAFPMPCFSIWTKVFDLKRSNLVDTDRGKVMLS